MVRPRVRGARSAIAGSLAADQSFRRGQRDPVRPTRREWLGRPPRRQRYTRPPLRFPLAGDCSQRTFDRGISRRRTCRTRPADRSRTCRTFPPTMHSAPGDSQPAQDAVKSASRPSRSANRSSLFAAVMHRHHAGLQAVRGDEIETPRALQALKQGRSMAGEDRVDDDAVLVDQPHPLERGRQRRGCPRARRAGSCPSAAARPRANPPRRGRCCSTGSRDARPKPHISAWPPACAPIRVTLAALSRRAPPPARRPP